MYFNSVGVKHIVVYKVEIKELKKERIRKDAFFLEQLKWEVNNKLKQVVV